MEPPGRPRGAPALWRRGRFVFLSVGAVELLAQNGIKPWVGHAPIGGQRVWNIANTSSTAIPTLVGTGPLPLAMRPIFWLGDQHQGSALVS